jgi:hypothetical protein
MERLIQAKLFGAGLVDVYTSTFVGRYNSCLEQLGIKPTKLTRFRIDCVGWSPEVAEEKGEPLYLSHGIPNQLAVILTPDQRKRPIYYPFNSFERRLIDTFFARYEAEIADITSTNAVAIVIDQGLTEFTTPQDLLYIDHVTVTASTDGGLMEAATGQRQLAGRFMDEQEGWFDPNLRAALMDSGKRYGDLRQRRLEIPEMQFEDLRSFYTVALGGVFVIRTEPDKEDLLVVQDKELLGTGKRHPKNVLWIHDPRLIDRLLNDDIVAIDFDWFREHPEELAHKLECLVAGALCTSNPEINFCELNPAQRKMAIKAARQSMPASYFELERVRKMLEQGAYPEVADLSRESRLALLHPSQSLPPWYRSVVWQLICRLTHFDPLRLYVADKNRFFELYQSWPESMRIWAVKTVDRLYRPHISNKE